MIDSRADIHKSAQIAEDVVIGPWTVIGANVEIDSGTVVGPHVVIEGPTRIGKNNRIYQFASIGAMSQDKKCDSEKTRLEIGDDNTFREFTTINRGTVDGGEVTKIGNHNWIMAYCHVAHDCIVGNNTVFSNNASLAGHVVVDDHTIISAFSGVHQFCRLGAHSFIGKASYVTKDVMPYTLISGYEPKAYGINKVGLRRRGFSDELITALSRAYKIIFRKNLTVQEACEQLQPLANEFREVAVMLDALHTSTRGITR